MKKKGILLIFNLVIAAICGFSVYSYYTKPLVDFEIGYKAEKELFEDLLKDVEGTEDFDIASAIPEDGVDLNIKLTVEPELLKKVMTSKEEDGVEYIYDDLFAEPVANLVDDLKPVLEDIAATAVKGMAKEQVKDQLLENLRSSDAFAGLDEEELNAKLEEAGITDEYLGELTDEIFAAFTEEGATVDTFADTIADAINDAGTKLEEAKKKGILPEYEIPEDITGEDLKEGINDALAELDLVDENGNIKDIDAALAALLNGALGGESDEGEKSKIKMRNVKFDGEPEPAPEEEKDLAETINDLLKEKITDALPTIATGLKFVGYFWLVEMIIWAWIIVKMIIRIFFKNPAVKVWLPIWFGWILGIFSIAINSLFGALAPTLAEAVPEAAEYLDGLTLTFNSSGTTAAICALALFIVWIPYSIFRRKLKREIKAEKRARREAE